MYRPPSDIDPAEQELNELSWLPDPEHLARTFNAVWSGDIDLPKVSLLATDLGDLHLLYPGMVHTLVGEAGQGKGWLATLACAQVVQAGQKILYLDFEDRLETFLGRMKSAGVCERVGAEHLHYARPDTMLPDGTLLKIMAEHGPFALVVIDGITEAFSVLQMDDWREVAKFLNLLVRPLKDSGAAVLQIDHPVKNADSRGRYAAGGHTKLGGIDAQYSVEAQVTFNKTTDGYSYIALLKDRHGDVGAKDYQIIARLDVTAADGPTKLTLTSMVEEDLLMGQSSKTASIPLPHSMQIVSRVLEIPSYRNDGLSLSRLRDAVAAFVFGGEDEGKVDVGAALERLVQQEYVQEYAPTSNTTKFRYNRKFREDPSDQQAADLAGPLLRVDDPTY